MFAAEMLLVPVWSRLTIHYLERTLQHICSEQIFNRFKSACKTHLIKATIYCFVKVFLYFII